MHLHAEDKFEVSDLNQLTVRTPCRILRSPFWCRLGPRAEACTAITFEAPNARPQEEEIIPKTLPFAHCGVLLLALTSLALLGAPIDRALGDKPSTPVTVVNPDTSPIPSQVVNPAASPALTSSVDDPGRVAYQSFNDQPSSCSGNLCQFVFPNVPDGHHLVIQHISGNFGFTGDPLLVMVDVFGGGAFSSFLAPVAHAGPAFFSAFDQPALLYFDAGVTASMQVFVGSSSFLGVPLVELSGYLLDCTVSPCAPIAH